MQRGFLENSDGRERAMYNNHVRVGASHTLRQFTITATYIQQQEQYSRQRGSAGETMDGIRLGG